MFFLSLTQFFSDVNDYYKTVTNCNRFVIIRHYAIILLDQAVCRFDLYETADRQLKVSLDQIEFEQLIYIEKKVGKFGSKFRPSVGGSLDITIFSVICLINFDAGI